MQVPRPLIVAAALGVALVATLGVVVGPRLVHEPAGAAAPAPVPAAAPAPVSAPAATAAATTSTAPTTIAEAPQATAAAPAKPAPAKARPAKAKPAQVAAAADDVEGDRLPETSAQSLPPLIVLKARRATAPEDALARRALTSRGVVLAPAVRQAIEDGEATAAALDLVVRIGHAKHQGPVLVHFIGGGTVKVQATTHGDTRTIVTVMRSLRPEPGVRLQPVAASFADAAKGSPEAAASGNIGAQAVTYALKWLGTPYSWGGGNAAGPTLGFCGPAGCSGEHTLGFDCSGLMLYAYAQVGIALDHYAAFQFLEGRRIEVRDLLPGDLVFFHPKADGPGHVGMYIGDGKFVEAPHTGAVVQVTPLASRSGTYMGAVRPY